MAHEQDRNSADPDLYANIDLPNTYALNAIGNTADIIKPWDARLDEVKYLKSDVGEQIIIYIPFISTVSVKALLLKTGPGGHTPKKVALYINQPGLDFSNIDSIPPTQEFAVPQSQEVGEYAVSTVKFSTVSSITLFFPGSQGEDSTRIYYIGFFGTQKEPN